MHGFCTFVMVNLVKEHPDNVPNTLKNNRGPSFLPPLQKCLFLYVPYSLQLLLNPQHILLYYIVSKGKLTAPVIFCMIMSGQLINSVNY